MSELRTWEDVARANDSVDNYLREHGYDPVALGLRTKVFVDTIIDNISKSQEIERLNDYIMRLLSDESRLWMCEACGSEFSSTLHGEHKIPTAEIQCPICGEGIAVPKAWIMQDEIARLREALSKIQDSAGLPGLTGQDYINAIEFRMAECRVTAREALEVKG